MSDRSSPKLSITLPKWLVDQVATYEKAYGWKRSTIIQISLRDWLLKQMPLEKKAKPDKLVAGQPYDPDKAFTNYVRPGMSDDEVIEALAEFEAATYNE